MIAYDLKERVMNDTIENNPLRVHSSLFQNARVKGEIIPQRSITQQKTLAKSVQCSVQSPWTKSSRGKEKKKQWSLQALNKNYSEFNSFRMLKRHHLCIANITDSPVMVSRESITIPKWKCNKEVSLHMMKFTLRKNIYHPIRKIEERKGFEDVEENKTKA